MMLHLWYVVDCHLAWMMTRLVVVVYFHFGKVMTQLVFVAYFYFEQMKTLLVVVVNYHIRLTILQFATTFYFYFRKKMTYSTGWLSSTADSVRWIIDRLSKSYIVFIFSRIIQLCSARPLENFLDLFLNINVVPSNVDSLSNFFSCHCWRKLVHFIVTQRPSPAPNPSRAWWSHQVWHEQFDGITSRNLAVLSYDSLHFNVFANMMHNAIASILSGVSMFPFALDFLQTVSMVVPFVEGFVWFCRAVCLFLFRLELGLYSPMGPALLGWWALYFAFRLCRLLRCLQTLWKFWMDPTGNASVCHTIQWSFALQ